MTWLEVEAYLKASGGIIIPAGSTEQHGPMGLIGTDALCAQTIAEGAARRVGSIVAPTLAYSPAPFNMAFPGTISVSEPLFESLASEIVDALRSQGFDRIYFLNGHGANAAPLKRVAGRFGALKIVVRSWWELAAVDVLRKSYYGDWEGMHATPSEVAITQAVHRIVRPPKAATEPPQKLTAEYIRQHAGDRHGPPDQHKEQFPDGRVGSHSALATPEHGRALLDTAVAEVARDYAEFIAAGASGGG